MSKQFGADYSGVAPKQGGGGGGLLPIKDAAGKRIKYLGRIESATGKTAKSGNPYVQYTLKVVGGEFDGQVLQYQSVTFLPREHEYAGIALHFLKCILQPFEGKFQVRPDDWAGKYVYFYVQHEEGQKTDSQGNAYVNNKVSGVDVLSIPELIDLGVIESAEDAPEWLQRAQAALDGTGKQEELPPANGKVKATTASAKETIAGKAKAKKDEAGPDAECEVCERKFKDHAKIKHEFKEALPF